MSPQTKKVDIFGSFLSGASSPPETVIDMSQVESHVDSDAATVEREILKTLHGAEGFVAVKDLLTGNVSRPTVAAKVINDLEKFGLVEKGESGPDLGYRLTGLGKGLAAS
jgi:predicted transcriptional regulator